MAFDKSISPITMIAIAVISIMAIVGQGHGLRVDYYKDKCNGKDVEGIVFKVVQGAFIKDKTIVASLLRLQFHDCFVRGCDASILLNGTNTEKTAPPNGSVKGFKLIDDAKAELEKACQGIVSCADIIVIATRAAVYLQSKRWYSVETGRLDGLVSLASDANTNLPSPSISVSTALKVFAARNLNAEDFVLLLAGHTVGITHCGFVQNRLYNYQNTGKPDKSMSLRLLKSLQNTCPKDGSGAGNPILLDQTPGSGLVVDNGFLKAIKQNEGVLEIDQRIATDPLTRDIVTRLLKEDFLAKFGAAMVKLGRAPRPTGAPGQIRTVCSAVKGGIPKTGGVLGGVKFP